MLNTEREKQFLVDHFERTKKEAQAKRLEYYQGVIGRMLKEGREAEIPPMMVEIESLAIYDTLTGCFTEVGLLREMIYNKIPELIREKKSYAVIYMDMNNLKLINDTLGHNEGNKAISSMFKAARVSVRPGDLISRWTKGDEGLIVLEGCKSGDAQDVVSRIREHLPPNIGVSMGISEGPPDYNFLDIVSIAEQQMYEDKNLLKHTDTYGNKAR